MANEETKPKATVVRVKGLEEFTAGIPVFVTKSDGEVELSKLDAPMSYVLTGDGVFLFRKGPVFTSFCPADAGIAGLGEVPAQVLYHFAPMPAKLAKQVLGFFRWAEVEHRSEAGVFTYYNPDSKEWKIHVPKQQVSAGFLSYEGNLQSYPGFVKMGTWHSHGSGSAYHSTIDHHDEEDEDGLHMTSGNFLNSDRVKTSISTQIVIDGVRYTIEPEDVFDIGIKLESRNTVTTIKWVGNDKVVEPERKVYDIVLDNKSDWVFPDEWKEQVTAKKVVMGAATSYGSSYGYYDDGYTWHPPTNPSVHCSYCIYHVYLDTLQRARQAVEFLEQPLNKKEKELLLEWPLVSTEERLRFTEDYESYTTAVKDALKPIWAKVSNVNNAASYPTPKVMVLVAKMLHEPELVEFVDYILLESHREQAGNTYSQGSFCIRRQGFYNEGAEIDADAMGQEFIVPRCKTPQDAGPCDWFLSGPFQLSSLQADRSSYERDMKAWDIANLAHYREKNLDPADRICVNCEKFGKLEHGEVADCPKSSKKNSPKWDDKACDKFVLDDLTDIEVID